jgi:PAS domain S-box-containing protein
MPTSGSEEIRLLHELQVHQVELETQNQELESSRARLQEAIAQYTELFDSAPVGYFLLSREATILKVNLAGAEILGGSPPELVGRHFKTFLVDSDVPAVNTFFELVFARSRQCFCEVNLVSAGQLPGRTLVLTATLSSNEMECRLVANDISERKLAEASSQALASQLRLSQKMEAVGTLATGIAHDFNNILAAQLGYVELAREAADQRTLAESLDGLRASVERAASLVRGLMTVRRPGEASTKPIPLGPVVEEALGLLQSGLPANVAFEVSLAEDTHFVAACAHEIHQVVMNLVANAAQAIGEQRSGRISVILRNHAVAAGEGLKAGPYLLLSISDTGGGMDAITKERAFEPFFTTKPQGEGTGLGLYVVHGILRSHRAHISMRSDVGEGTTIDILFPGLPGARPSTSAAPPRFEQGKGQRILHVDDEVAVGLVTKKLLERFGYQVEAEPLPQRALQTFRERPDDFDLVITDFSMPGLLGPDLAAQIHAMRPELPILLMSGYAADLSAESLRTAGIRETLVKPVPIRDLAAAVSRLLHPSE